MAEVNKAGYQINSNHQIPMKGNNSGNKGKTSLKNKPNAGGYIGTLQRLLASDEEKIIDNQNTRRDSDE